MNTPNRFLAGFLNHIGGFIKEAFGVVKFVTLPSPVAEIDKNDIVSKSLDGRFKKKLASIVERIVEPSLKPKSFTNSNGSNCYISGGEPLLELLCSTAEAVSTEIALDWPGALQRFREKATLARLDAQVASMGKKCMKMEGGHPLVIEVFARDSFGDVHLKTVKTLAEQAGLVVSAERSSLKIRGPPSQLHTCVKECCPDSLKMPSCKKCAWGQMKSSSIFSIL